MGSAARRAAGAHSVMVQLSSVDIEIMAGEMVTQSPRLARGWRRYHLLDMLSMARGGHHARVLVCVSCICPVSGVTHHTQWGLQEIIKLGPDAFTQSSPINPAKEVDNRAARESEQGGSREGAL